MTNHGRARIMILAVLLLLPGPRPAARPTAQDAAPAPKAQTPDVPSTVVDTVLRFTATDGTPLEAKLSLPAGPKGPVPVVFYLHGAGPRNYDHALQYMDADGTRKVMRYYDFYARELASRGIAFFRMSKRGCSSEPSGKPIVDRATFSKATPGVLLDDYAKALETLRERKDIDTSRIVLMGSSEGTRLAPRLALRSPAGIAGLVLMSHQSDNLHDTVVWQNSVGPWRNIQKIFPASADGTLTKSEYDAAVAQDASLAARLPFAAFDKNGDGSVTADEAATTVRPRLDAILKAVEDRNDDLIWQAVVNLSSAYLLEDWTSEPTHAILLKLDIPVGMFHGELDGTTRVEGVRETEQAFKAAGKGNLTVSIYPDQDHDLSWTPLSAATGGSQPHQDAFAFTVGLVAPVRR